MKEFTPKLNNEKVFTREFFSKYVYILVIGLCLLLGVSYSLTFFTQNESITTGRITTGDLTITVTDGNINISGILPPTDNDEGLRLYTKDITITNTTNIDGKVKLTLTRTSGLHLTDLSYALIVNGAIQTIGNVPSNGEILSTAIMGSEVINVEVRLWPKTTYSGGVTTFVGSLTPEIRYLGSKASDIASPAGKYVKFNCNGNNCEIWRIVKVEDKRLVLTRQADYSGATERAWTGKYYSSLSFNDASLISSVSDDNDHKNVYLFRTVKIDGGSGTQADPYTLTNNLVSEPDKKKVAVITYEQENVTIGTQNLYYGETNYISKVFNGNSNVVWHNNGNEYRFGDTVTFTSDTVLVSYPLLYDILAKEATRTDILSSERLAVTYTGAHQDSMLASNSTKTIYYFKANDDTQGDAIPEKNNVVFGNTCWQMIRTTDTGGVRLIYNGAPIVTEENGVVSYDCSKTRPGHMGVVSDTLALSGNFYYAASYTTSVSNGTTTYTLTSPTRISMNSTNIVSTLPGIIANTPYTCGTTATSCTRLYKIDSYSSGVRAKVYLSTTIDNVGLELYSAIDDSVSYVGYMYNEVYQSTNVDVLVNYEALIANTLDSSTLTTYNGYMFGSSYTLSGNNHVLTSPSTGSSLGAPSNWVGKYMCKSNSSSCEVAYYVSAIDTSGSNPIIYLAIIMPGGTDTDSSSKYLFGDSITANNDGTIEISGNVEEVLRKNWHTKYQGMTNKFVCLPGYYTYDSINDKYICDDNGAQNVGALKYISATTISSFTGFNVYKYGFGIAPESNSYKLVSNNDASGTLQYIYNWSSTSTSSCFTNAGDVISNCGYKSLNYSRYTCRNLTGICDEYYYILGGNTTLMRTITMENGIHAGTDITNQNNVLYLMLYQNDSNGNVNTINSTIKNSVDKWYQDNLYDDFDDYIDDTVYCNNRKIREISGVPQFSIWNPNGGTGNLDEFRYASAAVGNDLSCSYVTDRFSVSNSAAKLTYKVGLITFQEVFMMGNKKANASIDSYWTMSPNYSYNTGGSRITYVPAAGTNSYYNASYLPNRRGVRPVISLIPEMTYYQGDGSTTSPYVVYVSNN